MKHRFMSGSWPIRQLTNWPRIGLSAECLVTAQSKEFWILIGLWRRVTTEKKVLTTIPMVKSAYLSDLSWRLESEDADDLSKPADLDEDECVAEGAGGRRQTAKQQVLVTVVTKVWETGVMSGRRFWRHSHTHRTDSTAAATASPGTTAASAKWPGLGRSRTQSSAGCLVYVATCNTCAANAIS